MKSIGLWVWCFHALVVGALLTVIWSMPKHTGDMDFTIVPPGFAMIVLGFPWSVLLLGEPGTPGNSSGLTLYGPAVINLAVHGGVLVAWALHRRRRTATTAP